MEKSSTMRLRSEAIVGNDSENPDNVSESEVIFEDTRVNDHNPLGLSPAQLFELECKRADAEERRAEAERNAEERRAEREHEFRMAQLQSQQNEGQFNNYPQGNRLPYLGLNENERLARAVRESLPRLEVSKESITKTFCIIESSFRHHKVPTEMKASLLLSIMGSQIPNLFVICSEADLIDYEAIKRAILKEMRLSPSEYHSKFLNLRKNEDTNYLEFANQLTGIFELYLECREVSTIQDLKDLIIADQFKAGLKPATLRHVLMQEADSWFKIEKLSRLCENFDVSNSVGRLGKIKDYIPDTRGFGQKMSAPRKEPETNLSRNATKHHTGYEQSRKSLGGYEVRPYHGVTKPLRTTTEDLNRRERRCFECNATDHLRNKCPTLAKRVARENTAHVNRISIVDNARGKVNMTVRENPGKEGEGMKDLSPDSPLEFLDAFNVQVNRISTSDDARGVRANVNVTVCENPWKDGEGMKDLSPDSPLEFVEVFSGGKRIKGLIDSGAEICVFRSGIIPNAFVQTLGNITLRHAFEGSVRAKSVIIPLSLEEGDAEPVEINAAITERLCADAIIPPKIIRDLKDLDPNRKIIAGLGLKVNETKNVVMAEGEDEINDPEVVDTSLDDDRENIIPELTEGPRTDNEKFKVDQKGCRDLSESWSKALQKKEGFFIKNEILMHQDHMLGNVIEQVVVPKEYRGQVMGKAHDEACGAHLGEKRSLERILKSFYWPYVKRDVKRYVSSCHQCQTRRVINCKDRVPIKAIERTSRPFEIWITDVIGPLEPPSSRGHRYILTAVDLCTRWPEAWPLKRVTAKSTCDAFLQIFARTGLPRMICSDGGSNFASQLTTNFHQMLGISPRIASPHHPESVGLCERFNQTLKNMMHHIVMKHNKKWDEYLPLLLFAYRETSNATLGCSPYQLVYGHLPINPLGLLKELWSGDSTVPTRGVEDTYEYISELKAKISEIMELANNSAVKQQDTYQGRYNRRAKYKTFKTDDLVMILTPSSTHKLLKHWIGPCKVLEKNREHQYLVETPEKVRKVVHVNIMRRYVIRINNLGIISEPESEEFGKIHCAPQKKVIGKSDSEIVQKCSVVPNLNSEQREQLERCLLRNRDVFSDQPGLCTKGSHRIALLAEAEPKKIFPYRIPHALRSEIANQIKDLLDMGLIEKAHLNADALSRLKIDYG